MRCAHVIPPGGEAAERVSSVALGAVVIHAVESALAVDEGAPHHLDHRVGDRLAIVIEYAAGDQTLRGKLDHEILDGVLFRNTKQTAEVEFDIAGALSANIVRRGVDGVEDESP